MKCPVQQGLLRSDGEKTVIEWPECLKEECACWDTTFNWCTEQTIAHALYAIASELGEVRKKMPHEEQFRK